MGSSNDPRTVQNPAVEPPVAIRRPNVLFAMASFVYLARDTVSGREIRSSVDAATEQAALAALLNRNLLVVSIQEKVGKKGKTSGGRVALADLVIFTRQLATMIDAGLAMVQSLQALAEQTTNKVMRDVIHDVTTRVVFICPYGSNALDILRTGKGNLEESDLKTVGEISELAKERWIVPRAARRPEYQMWNRESIPGLILGTAQVARINLNMSRN